ncbi:InlB B-repeat-containing protein [Anaerostipes sp. PC18]|uniref:InlB B-repeat-containing protein n=1 Tax=Anaerostipes sp. PC18 TaxID=3036926 RepID=UPI003085931C|nr:InlB B-repeat-containing protein [Anaerostipes sp. PC18]
MKAGVIIIQATNEYKIVSSDIEKIHIGNENLFAYLDSANNVVKITDLRLNGGTVTDTSPLGKRQLPVPVKEGYIFNGWYNKEEFNGEIMNTVEEGQIYYAKWTEKTSTSVSFRENLNLNKIYDGNAMSLSENDYIVTEGAGKK